jgi:hypothetical protein
VYCVAQRHVYEQYMCVETPASVELASLPQQQLQRFAEEDLVNYQPDIFKRMDARGRLRRASARGRKSRVELLTSHVPLAVKPPPPPPPPAPQHVELVTPASFNLDARGSNGGAAHGAHTVTVVRNPLTPGPAGAAPRDASSDRA